MKPQPKKKPRQTSNQQMRDIFNKMLLNWPPKEDKKK